jgi:hypothetical protein
MDKIDLAIRTEILHRHCFDSIYVQGKTTSETDLKILEKYDNLFRQCPNFRQICWQEFQILNNIEQVNHSRLTEIEKDHLESLKQINFNRYGFKTPG